MGVLQLDRWDVAAPRAEASDHFGLVETVDGLGQRVVIARTDRTDRRGDAGA
jgi:hypothetical protein